ncbi:hypothetical protein Q7P37_009599 [Cladosporium fusiforme]
MPPHCSKCHKGTISIKRTLEAATKEHSKPPFAEYLDLVSFVAVITISFSLSASQGFATSGTFLGTTLNSTASDPESQTALNQTRSSARLLSWSAAASGFSLMITLALRILQTYDRFVELSKTYLRDCHAWYEAVPRILVGLGSWASLALQAASMVLIGQALKIVSPGSGWMIQVRLHVHVEISDDVRYTLHVKRLLIEGDRAVWLGRGLRGLLFT